MRILKNKWFERFALKQGITDNALKQAIGLVEQGLIDANLGAGVIKQRIAKHGQGKSSGFRTIILYCIKDKAFFVYGFEKSSRANLTKAEESVYKKAAQIMLALTNEQIDEQIEIGELFEVTTND
ncbi:MAG: type II toxin-antitoxin system RelE/ParE family toxin [Moraxellaceae bacterium]|nr:type II toxin-antitoxin system RelE/ParE family toxin [Pseudomonadales bacterium]MCP5175142.1 type II toxin-antitoxin system RelE/ParE family toxin [Moraxellaceae bacterium]MCP5177364.1 type II toxin-antitoxin system RelE/ParE family toxin [Moraxellaceae bacterium]